MIKKILSSLLVSSVLLVFAATGSMAERPTLSLGYTATYGGYEANGTEHEGSANPREQADDTAAGEIGYSSLFIEASFADRVTVGASWMIDAVETGMQERTDSPLVADTSNNSGTSTVKAEFSNLVTGYVEVNLYNGLYAKYGYMEMDLETKESLHTDSAYPNATMDGTTYGLGWKGSFDNGIFIKTETLMQEWSDLTLQGSGATDTDNNTQVDLSLSVL